jgi:glutamate-ammonia-ligase adenylyltransferase
MTTDHQPYPILSGQLTGSEIRRWLSPAGFADYKSAHRCLVRLDSIPGAAPALADLLPHLLVTLSSAANPDRVLVSLERFVRSADDSAAMLGYLAGQPRAVEILTTLFAGSQFLTEILLRNPEHLMLLMAQRLKHVR